MFGGGICWPSRLAWLRNLPLALAHHVRAMSGQGMSGQGKMEKASEGPTRITRATIEAAWRRRRPGFRLTIRDAECRGLALVVNPTGMAWMLSYKPRGLDPRTGKRPATREVLVGTPATHSPEQARAEGAAMKGEAKRGSDPARERKAAMAAAAGERASTVKRLMEDYAIALPARPKMRGTGTLSPAVVKEELHHLRAAIATMDVGDLPVTNMGQRELRTLLTKEAKRPATARHRFGALSRFLDWCQDERLIPRNPCADVTKARRPRPVQPRTHHLSIAEMGQLWRAAAAAADAPDASDFLPVHRDYVRFLLAVPARRNEAARVEWPHLDLEAGYWSMPGKLTKNGDPFRVPLPAVILPMLLKRQKAAGEGAKGLVFPSPKARKAITTFSAIKLELDKASGLTGWRWHDFRRSFVAAMANNGVDEAIADAMLNHRQASTRGGVLGIYQQAKRRPEQDAAMRRWNELLTAAIEEKRPQEGVVVRLPKAVGGA
ncbi:tyrosine-type recombinase/integrase [Roseomonas chloroacetimidivorans]|uniref:tyrosine-type recombinase/integrase n=1 Tax=Roseomonas chloroacetimidivorans TaxID=1766656 RepID=UPI003C7634E8